jgi:uncharacterized protein YndB with AHSA1/START domain
MPQNEANSKMEISAKGREFIVARTFDAPRDLVFKAWTEPERLAQWWGPRGWTTTNYSMEVKPGGVWHYCMRGPGGEESWGKSVYQEVVVPERIVYTDAFSDAEGNVSEGMPVFTITMTFSEQEGKTRVASYSVVASEEELQTLLNMGMVEGLTETWDRLEEYLATA